MYSHIVVTDVEKFRLERINEIRNEIIAEMMKHEQIYKKYKTITHVSEVFDSGLVTISAGLSGGVVATTFLPPVATGLGIAGGVTALLGLIFKAVSKRCNSKQKISQEIISLSKTKINIITNLISNTLEDGKISDEELRLISDELASFYKSKTDIKKKRNQPNDDTDNNNKKWESAFKKLFNK